MSRIPKSIITKWLQPNQKAIYNNMKKYCLVNIDGNINYCIKCKTLVQPEQLEYVSSKFGYLDSKYCVKNSFD